MITAGLLAACATPQPKGMVGKKQRSKEYFAETEYGVKASPRVTLRKSNLTRGGGRDQIGRPYMVRGKMYYPKEDKKYKKIGLASWYGDAFHGRLTANGEVYDMTHLTAAHPTMPLPSYARVTNMTNGSSVIVRVNDRGPYADGRLIDLSQRAAEMLDYTQSGTAKVKVEYVGRAPLDGNDDRYLLASYKPGKGMDPSDGLPTGVMVAMNGPTPSGPVGKAAFPGVMQDVASEPTMSDEADPGPVMTANAALPGALELPDFGPIAPERPVFDLLPSTQVALATMSYADERVRSAARAFDALDGTGLSADDIARSWKRTGAIPAPTAASEPFVAAGSYTQRAEADRVAAGLAAFGQTAVVMSKDAGQSVYSVNLYADGRNDLDVLLQSAWSHGAPDAIAVRD